jgi:hypothetical protein
MAITSSMIVISNSCSQHRRRPSHDLPTARAKSARLGLTAGVPSLLVQLMVLHVTPITDHARPRPTISSFQSPEACRPVSPLPGSWSRATSGRKWLHGQSRDTLWRSDSKIGR